MDVLLKTHLPQRSGTGVSQARPCTNLLVLDLELPWCGTKLKWQVLRDLARPDLPPDFVCVSGGGGAAGFNPLLCGGDAGEGDDSDGSSDVKRLLDSWRPGPPATEARAIAALTRALLRAFGAEQRRRLAALADARVSFELGMLDGGGGGGGDGGSGSSGCPELLLSDDPAAGRRACFGVPLRGVDLSCAAPLRAYQRRTGCGYGGGGGSSGTTAAPAGTTEAEAATTAAGVQPAESDPLAAVAAAAAGAETPAAETAASAAADTATAATEDSPSSGDGSDGGGSSGFYLHVAFPVGAGASAAAAGPALSLEAPPWFAAAALPPLPLPPWDPQAPLAEYAHAVAGRLRQHLQQHCTAAAAKYQLVDELAALFGPPLEARMAAAASGAPAGVSPAASTAPGYSYAAAAAALGAPIVGSGSGISGGGISGGLASCVAVFNVLYDGQPLLLFVEASPRFPEEQPALALQSVRRAGLEGCATFTAYPWSPRWPVGEMAARIYNFIHAEAASAAARLHGTGAGAGGA